MSPEQNTPLPNSGLPEQPVQPANIVTPQVSTPPQNVNPVAESTEPPIGGMAMPNPQTTVSTPAPVSYQMQADQSPGKSKKPIIIVAAVVMALLVASIAAWTLLSSDDGSPASNVIDKVINEDKAVIDRPDGTLELSEKINGMESIANQTVEGKKLQQFNMLDGRSFLVQTVNRNAEARLPARTSLRPAAGNEMVQIILRVGNREETEFVRFSNFDFQLHDSEGNEFKKKAYDTAIFGPGSPDRLSPGQQETMNLMYEVPSAKTGLRLSFIAEYTRIGTSSGTEPDKVELKGTVELD